MPPTTRQQALDRHAFVMAIWLAAGLVAATLFHYGLATGGTEYLLAAFGVVLVAFVGHVVVNAVLETPFTRRELALGLVLYVVALIAFGLATLFDPDFGRAFLPVSAGFLLVFLAVGFYLVTSTGLRETFDAFDVVRTFRASSDRQGLGSQDRPR